MTSLSSYYCDYSFQHYYHMSSDVMGPLPTAGTLPWPSVSPPMGPSLGPCHLRSGGSVQLHLSQPGFSVSPWLSLNPRSLASSCLSMRPTSDRGTFPRWTSAGCPWGGGHTCPRQPSRWPPDTLSDGPTLPPGPYNNTRPSGHLRSLLGRPEAQAWGQEAPGLAALKASFSLGLLPPPPTPPAE